MIFGQLLSNALEEHEWDEAEQGDFVHAIVATFFYTWQKIFMDSFSECRMNKQEHNPSVLARGHLSTSCARQPLHYCPGVFFSEADDTTKSQSSALTINLLHPHSL